MANIGDKYIIEISGVFKNEDQRFGKPLYKMMHFNSLVFDEEGIRRLTPYEPNNDEEYQRGLNDAWEAARKIAGAPSLGGLTTHEVMELFGTSLATEVMYMVTVDQAIEKLRTYEAKKKAEEEIKVGDEVETDYNGNGIIAQDLNNGWYAIMLKGLYRSSIHKSHIIKKTGRHFPQVAELLDAMEEDGET